jgi:hypothetical protein
MMTTRTKRGLTAAELAIVAGGKTGPGFASIKDKQPAAATEASVSDAQTDGRISSI